MTQNKRISTNGREGSTKIRVICSDPDATDSSSDEIDDRRDERSVRSKRIVHEIVLRNKDGDKARLWLGTYDNAEEASKTQEFEAKTMVASQKPKNKHLVCNQSVIESPSSVLKIEASERVSSQTPTSYESPPSLVLKIEASTNDRINGNTSGPKYPEETDQIPTAKRYKEGKWAVKKLEFEERSKKQRSQPIVANESKSQSSNGTIKEGLLMGQFWPASSGEDSNCGLGFGSMIIDNHGFLLGEFSRLDDLRICDIEGDKMAHHIC